MLIAALLFAATVTTPAPRSPRLCLAPPDADLMAGSCVDAKTREIAVEPSEKARNWLWIDSARKTVALGNLPPKATKIVVSDKPAALFTITGSPDRGWPAATTIVLSTSKDHWKFTLPGNAVASLSAVAVSPGKYSLQIEAPRHIAWSMRVLEVTQSDKPAPLGRIELKPVPTLRGRFIDQDDKGVPDVAVSSPDGALLALSDPAGYVHEELGGTLPPRLFIRRSGFGHRNVDVTRNDTDFDLGTVRLSPGSTLTINVDRNGYDGPLTASLIRPGEHTVGKRTTFETVTVKPDVSRIELADIEARDYVLMLHGEGPMQVLQQDLTVAEHENATKDVRIGPRSVKAFVHRGSAPISNTDILLAGANGEWSGSIKTDDEGTFRTDAWMPGHVGISIDRGSPVRYYHTSKEISQTDSEWDVAIPDRTIRGIVVDKESGTPVPVKSVMLRSVRLADGTGGLRPVPVGDDGIFEIAMAQAGKYEITAQNPAYLDAMVAFEIKPDDHDRDVRVEMEHGRNVRVKIANADGTPSARAMIIAPRTMADASRFWSADPDGVATVVLRSSDPLQAWVVAPDNGFTIATISPDANDGTNTIQLPPATSTIAVRTAHDDFSAAPHSHLFLAYNGNLLPDDVRGALGPEHLLTGSDGIATLIHMPPGEYDFWARETQAERVTTPAARFLGAPVHASILPGDNAVTVKTKAPETPIVPKK